MAQRNGSARVLSVMQELRQLRDKVCMLSDKNRELAKALTTTKQELTKARAAQSAVFSDKVVKWMEARYKPVGGKTAMLVQAIQCSFEELDRGTCVSVERTELEPEPPLSPLRNGGADRTLHLEPRVPSPFAMHERVSMAVVREKTTNTMAVEEKEYTPGSGDAVATISDDNGVGTISTADLSESDHQCTRLPHIDSGSGSQAGVKRRLRQRDTVMSYVEPQLNTKLRRGDDYGLGKRAGQPKPRLIDGPRRAKSAFVPTRFGQQQERSPFGGRRTSRPVKRVSYAEPKLSTKLRQDQEVANGNAQADANGENNATANGKPAPAAVNPNSFEEQYTLGKVIGSGTFSVVRIAVHKPTGQRYAIKCIKREGLVAEDIEALTTEVAILKQMNHPNIMILHDFFVEEKFYYLVTEFMEGGELFDRIVEKSYYNEREARDLVKLLLEAIKYCHDANIVHRDLKPENLLLTSKNDDASIKLADFGFAKRIEFDSEGLVTACGTPGYVAPEILEGKPYGKTVDIWSIGVITYILLCGYPPFHDDNHNALFKKIKKGKFQFDSPYWDHVSDDAKDLISQMLVVDPEKRATVDQLLAHRWVTGTEVATVQLTSALEELRRFNARRKFKAAVSTVSTTVGFSKKYSKSYSQPQSSLDEAADAELPEVSPDTVDLDLDGSKTD
ncbi:hypothetical protein PHYPSEUDO_000509 [Phytophthora pseudosyringae]|uniref:non-specific serine/threonine protein kinase n=1 Tax=Phytophthora pseudosyringae TaxID=221518 RepID=A0A8T1W0Z2_9STRA|nr:hypothetical protein PHYPSEUDO_000509 [Phytophthora pseudosyringae]